MRLPEISIGFNKSSKKYIALGVRIKYCTDEKYFQLVVWLSVIEFVIEVS